MHNKHKPYIIVPVVPEKTIKRVCETHGFLNKFVFIDESLNKIYQTLSIFLSLQWHCVIITS